MSASSYFKHESAIVDEGAIVGEGSRIWHFTHVASGARLGRDDRAGVAPRGLAAAGGEHEGEGGDERGLLHGVGSPSPSLGHPQVLVTAPELELHGASSASSQGSVEIAGSAARSSQQLTSV